MQLFADIPVWLIPFVFAGIMLSVGFLFFKRTGIQRWLLLLRGVIWILLFLLLANPWLGWTKIIELQPQITFWVDRSLSVGNDNLNKFKQTLSAVDSVKMVFLDLNTGKEIKRDSIKADETYTDFSALEHKPVQADYEWLISDGNSNHGKKDIHIAKSRTINAIVTGDTSNTGDVGIIDVNLPVKMYTGVKDTLSVVLNNTGFANAKTVNLQLFANGRNFYNRNVRIGAEAERRVKIPLLFKQSGHKNIRIQALGKFKDANPANQVVHEKIFVEPQQKQLLLLWGYPIPEINYLRFFLRDMKSVKIIDNTDFNTGKMPDAIITFAYPQRPLTAQETAFWRKAKEQNIPVIYFSHDKILFSQLEKLGLPLEYRPGAQPEILPVELPPGQYVNPVINPLFWPEKKIAAFFNERPPLVRDFRIGMKAPDKIVLKALKDDPGSGFFVLSANPKRRAALIAGWNSYLLFTSSIKTEVAPLWENIMQTLTEWILTSPQSAGIYHNIPDTLVQSLNSNLFEIKVVDDFGENIKDARVSMVIQNGRWRYENTARYNGLKYVLDAPYMSVGDYNFELTAVWGAGEKKTRKGHFYVANIGPEKLSKKRNTRFIRSFAKGEIIPVEDLNPGLFAYPQVREPVKREIYLFPVKWVLWTILLLFIIDLYVRKRFQVL